MNFYFETPRPEVMILEKSTDYGLTFSAWQYYARDCAEKFPGVKTTPINRQDPTAVICTEEYAKMVSKKVTTLRPPLFLHFCWLVRLLPSDLKCDIMI